MTPASQKLYALAAATAAALFLSACGGGGSASGSTPPAAGNGGTLSGPTAALGSAPYLQLDRLNRPGVNEVFATFAQHQQNNVDTPDQDAAVLGPEIVSFTENVGGRSSNIANVLRSVLTPDVQIVDLSGRSLSCIRQPAGTCNNYLGIETKGATQLPKGLKPFGGRALTDDIIDISLSAIFGDVVPKLGLAPDDGKESDGRADATFPSGHRPDLTSDHVSFAAKHFSTTFPYYGPPQ